MLDSVSAAVMDISSGGGLDAESDGSCCFSSLALQTEGAILVSTLPPSPEDALEEATSSAAEGGLKSGSSFTIGGKSVTTLLCCCCFTLLGGSNELKLLLVLKLSDCCCGGLLPDSGSLTATLPLQGKGAHASALAAGCSLFVGSSLL